MKFKPEKRPKPRYHKTPQIAVSMSEELLDRIITIARERNLPKGTFCRQAIEYAIANMEEE